jgi:hypothetical protein
MAYELISAFALEALKGDISVLYDKLAAFSKIYKECYGEKDIGYMSLVEFMSMAYGNLAYNAVLSANNRVSNMLPLVNIIVRDWRLWHGLYW